MNYILFCRTYYMATRIPIHLIERGKLIYSSIAESLEILPDNIPQIAFDSKPYTSNPELFMHYPEADYGRIQIEETDLEIVIGPVFSISPSEKLIRDFMKQNMIPLQFRQALINFFSSAPRCSSMQLIGHLAHVHLVLNGKECSYDRFFSEMNQLDEQQKSRQIYDLIKNTEECNFHNSYEFEMQLYQYIREGNSQRMEEFLTSLSAYPKLGQMADTPLRQEKNIFIAFMTKVIMLGVIPGGVMPETAYQLSDFYSRQCEQMTSLKQIRNLEIVMLKDLCKKSEEAHIPTGVSKEVYTCMNYIRTHVNEYINVKKVANVINRSTSYITKRFKKELGIQIGAFITRCKLEEAKSLLTYTDKSLAEISNYLCFSGQSYFQTVFKKQYGVTPLQYRKGGMTESRSSKRKNERSNVE